MLSFEGQLTIEKPISARERIEVPTSSIFASHMYDQPRVLLNMPESRLLQLPHEILALILHHVFEPWYLESFPNDKDYARACVDTKHASSKPPCCGPLLTCKTFYKLLKDKPRTCFSGTIYYHYRISGRSMFSFPRPAPQTWQRLVPMVKTVYLPESTLNLPPLWEDTHRLSIASFYRILRRSASLFRFPK